MTMCPYKWALYIAGVLAILWVTVQALLHFGSVADGTGDGGGHAPSKSATTSATRDATAASSASDTDDDDDGPMGAGEPLDDSEPDGNAVPPPRQGEAQPSGDGGRPQVVAAATAPVAARDTATVRRRR
ncbi:hypothetical protein MMPV_006168 [Pyropia vietnamensis]